MFKITLLPIKLYIQLNILFQLVINLVRYLVKSITFSKVKGLRNYNFSSIFVISASNAVYLVLFLILSFVTSVSILFLLDYEFIALIFIVIKFDAIAVLFWFFIMILDVKLTSSFKEILKYFQLRSLLCLSF